MPEPVNEWKTEITSQIERRKAQAEALRRQANKLKRLAESMHGCTCDVCNRNIEIAKELDDEAAAIERGDVTVGGRG